MYRFLLLLTCWLLAGGSILSAQSTSLLSVNPEFTLLLNEAATGDFGFGYTVSRRSPGYSFGLTVRRRHFSRKGSVFSFEYGLGVHRTTTRLDVNRTTGERADISLQTTDLSLPLRLFFDGFKPYKGLFRSQSGLFVGIHPAVRLRGEDVLRNVFTSHGAVGVRTRGKKVYVQLSYAWPLFSSDTSFTALEQGFILDDSNRRFTFLSLGYTFRS